MFFERLMIRCLIDESAWPTRGLALQNLEPQSIASLQQVYSQWRISFDYFALYEQSPFCAPLFTLSFLKRGWSKYHIENKWCIAGKRLRMQILPSKTSEYLDEIDEAMAEKEKAWTVGEWNTVELTQVYEDYYESDYDSDYTPDYDSDGNPNDLIRKYYISFKLNGRVVWKRRMPRVELAKDLSVTVGQYRWTWPQPLDVYLDNFNIETWPNDQCENPNCNPSEENVIPDVEFEPNRTELVGDGNCYGWKTVFDLCIDIRVADGNGINWYDAREMCRSDNTSLITIENDLQNFVLSQLVGERTWIGGNDLKTEGTWTDSEGRPLEYSRWHPKTKQVPEQPDNKNGDQHCVHLSSSDRKVYNNIGHTFQMKQWIDKECYKKIEMYACAYKRFGKR